MKSHFVLARSLVEFVRGGGGRSFALGIIISNLTNCESEVAGELCLLM